MYVKASCHGWILGREACATCMSTRVERSELEAYHNVSKSSNRTSRSSITVSTYISYTFGKDAGQPTEELAQPGPLRYIYFCTPEHHVCMH